MNNNTRYCLFLVLFLFLFIYFRQWNDIVFFSLRAAGSVGVVVLLTMKIELTYAPLQWVGEHLFWIYILQGLSMITFKHFGIHRQSEHLYSALCLGCTLALATLFQRHFHLTEKALFAKPPPTTI